MYNNYITILILIDPIRNSSCFQEGQRGRQTEAERLHVCAYVHPSVRACMHIRVCPDRGGGERVRSL